MIDGLCSNLLGKKKMSRKKRSKEGIEKLKSNKFSSLKDIRCDCSNMGMLSSIRMPVQMVTSDFGIETHVNLPSQRKAKGYRTNQSE